MNKGLNRGVKAAILVIVIASGSYYFYSQHQAQLKQQQQAWSQAEQSNSITGYQQYLQNWGDSDNAAHAQQQIETLQQEARIEEEKRQAQAREAIEAQNRRQTQIKQAQHWLHKHGYAVTQSGDLDKRTQKAIEAFEKAEGLLITGSVDNVLIEKLESSYNRKEAKAQAAAARQTLIKGLQTELKRLRYYQGSIDGQTGNATTGAIKRAQKELKLSINGSPSQSLLTRLKQTRKRPHPIAIQQLIASMKTIPAGSFMMGSNDGESNEKPVHRVNIGTFRLMEHEVTFAQWDRCVSDGACSNKPDDEGWGRGNRPVINVSWNDITQQFIPWLNKKTGRTFRLPTEAEWEYAARAGSNTKYSWGNSISCSQASYGYYSDECGEQKSTDLVKSFSPNNFGLYDMHGNVGEWAQDCYNDSYRNALNDGSADESGSCDSRVLRSGSWGDNPQFLRSAFRFGLSATSRNGSIGFRLAEDLN